MLDRSARTFEVRLSIQSRPLRWFFALKTMLIETICLETRLNPPDLVKAG